MNEVAVARRPPNREVLVDSDDLWDVLVALYDVVEDHPEGERAAMGRLGAAFGVTFEWRVSEVLVTDDPVSPLGVTAEVFWTGGTEDHDDD